MRSTVNSPEERRWQIRMWIVYLLGLPAWVVIFCYEHNWMAASVEAGGAPAMVLGLIVAFRGSGQAPRWLDYLAVAATAFGISYSVWDFGGITTLNQVFELGVVAGFLLGTYLLAKKRASGCLWFAVMNISNALLMGYQQYYWLCVQQIVSLYFVSDAYVMYRRRGPQSLSS
jgi:hypothetical protein